MLLLLLLSQQFGPPPGEGSLYAERLNWALNVSKMTQTDLARRIGVTPQSIQHLCDPQKHARGSRNTVAIAAATGVVAKWLATGKGDAIEEERPPSDSLEYAEWVKSIGPPTLKSSKDASTPIGMREVPLLNYVQAGAMAESAPNFPVDEYLLTDLDLSERAFALEIKGKSMVAPPGSGEDSFNEGDRIIVDCDTTPLPGDFVVAKNGPDGEHGEHAATFKKYRPRGADEHGREVFELVPLNPDYPTMRSDRQPIRIIGVMMEHRKYRKKR